MDAEIYPYEEMITASGYPCLKMFQNGKPELPLVIFITGEGIFARVAYGHPSGQPSDFLAHWFKEAGYPFLALTYPMDHPVYSTFFPEFSVIDWGNQIAEIAEEVIQKNGLKKSMIALGWSIGGRVVESLNAALTLRNLSLEFFIGLSPCPPVFSLIPAITRGFKMTEKGYVENSYEAWLEENLKIQDALNRRVVIPENVFQKAYLGHYPINLGANNYRYHREQFVPDVEEDINDSGAFTYTEYPLIGLLIHNSVKDERHALMDVGVWSFYMTQSISHNLIFSNPKDLNRLTDIMWRKLLDLVRTAPMKLTIPMDGGHFFFLGERGAKSTFDKFLELSDKIRTLKNEIQKILK